jgi:acyl-CoA synthetase (NDP forming)
MADLAVGRDVTFPDLTDNQHQELAEVLGPMVKRANPLDYHTFIWADTDAMSQTYSAMMADQIGLGMVVADFPRSDRGDATEWDTVIDAVIAAKESTGRPITIVASLPENMPEPISERLVQAGVAPLCGLQEAIIAAEIAANSFRPGEPPEELLLPGEPLVATVLNEVSAKRSLEDHGTKIPGHQPATTPAMAGSAAKEIGFPVVLKGLGVAHKTEAGAVVLNLTTESDVVEAAVQMSCDGFLVEAMVTNAVAELLIGVVLDPAHGYVLTIGAGGTLTELLEDKASLLIPSQSQDVLAALKTLKVWKLLNGYRGRPAADIPAIVQTVMAVQTYVQAEHGKILEVEINPLICREDDAVAADALIKKGE